MNGKLIAFAPYGLTEYTIPNSVTSIGENAFDSCSRLTSIYCKPTVPPTLSYEVFYRMWAKIYVPMMSVDAYKTAQYWSNYASKIVGYDF